MFGIADLHNIALIEFYYNSNYTSLRWTALLKEGLFLKIKDAVSF